MVRWYGRTIGCNGLFFKFIAGLFNEGNTTALRTSLCYFIVIEVGYSVSLIYRTSTVKDTRSSNLCFILVAIIY